MRRERRSATMWSFKAFKPCGGRTAGSAVIVVGSVKSTVGHLLTAAGAAGVTKVLLSLRLGVLPPTAKLQVPGREIDFTSSPFRILFLAPKTGLRPAGQPLRRDQRLRLRRHQRPCVAGGIRQTRRLRLSNTSC